MDNFWRGFEKQAWAPTKMLSHGAGGALAGGVIGAATADKGKRTKGAVQGAALGGALGTLHGHAKANQAFNTATAARKSYPYELIEAANGYKV